MFEIVTQEGVVVGDPFEICADAAQEAEFLHTEQSQKFIVRDVDTKEVFYESKGGPD